MQQSGPHSLFVWGRGYEQPTQLAAKVQLVAAGQNHIIYTTPNGHCFGVGSNKFGQLGVSDCISFGQPRRIFDKLSIRSIHCGCQHTFVITDKYEVYSCGLNIKGQLGHSLFENTKELKLVVGLLPFGVKNQKSVGILAQRQPKPPILDILEKFDLQVKLDDAPQLAMLLANQEYIEQIACGALFSLALSNKGKLFVSGSLGRTIITTHDEQLEKAKFRHLVVQATICRINASLSGVVAMSAESQVYVWGVFGKLVFNVGKKIAIEGVNKVEEKFYDCGVGDQFCALLNMKGELYVFGRNIDNQLGCQTNQIAFQLSPKRVENTPFFAAVYVGRNYVYAVDAETKELYGWGANKFQQIFPLSHSILHVVNSKFVLNQDQKIIPTAYFTLLKTQRKTVNFVNTEKKQKQNKKQQETVLLSEYKKLLNDFQIMKGINLTLIEKHHLSKKQSKETQTTSKFDISGITQFRRFNQNVQVPWKQLQLQTQINEGGYGIIYRAKWRQILVVVKKFKIQNGEVSLRDFLSECNAMQALRHPHIVMFLGAVTVSPHYSLILQYCSRGSLWSYLQNKDNVLTWEDRRRFSIQIAQGVHYLHECFPPILHRDLKSLNIFLDSALRIKIGDFGWTKTLDQYMTNKIGTYQWMAPEVIGNKPYTEKADVFSYSIIMWEIASREPPYKNINGAKVSEDVLHKDLRPNVPQKAPQSYVKLMKRCWESDPNKRPSFKQIIKELQVMKLQK